MEPINGDGKDTPNRNESRGGGSNSVAAAEHSPDSSEAADDAYSNAYDDTYDDDAVYVFYIPGHTDHIDHNLYRDDGDQRA
ncbi:MAG: hypothetical protein HC808_09070 [Candidatus Competibacteraceae bacterium]|nr:hypothetical protein [Candidatus Competibacteraceae bacterium]